MLKPTCPKCGFQDDMRTAVVAHIVKTHGISVTEARELLTFKQDALSTSRG